MTALVGFATTLDEHGDDLDRLRRGGAEARREPADLQAIVANALGRRPETAHADRTPPRATPPSRSARTATTPGSGASPPPDRA